jgi:putative FmdB family regulatory protein
METRPVPTYQYLCTACERPLEVQQSFSDAALTVCPVCAGRLRKVFSAVGVVFKGSGFYRNDSRAASVSGANGSGNSAGSNGSGADGSESGGDKSGDKTAARSGDTTGDKSGDRTRDKSGDRTRNKRSGTSAPKSGHKTGGTAGKQPSGSTA